MARHLALLGLLLTSVGAVPTVIPPSEHGTEQILGRQLQASAKPDRCKDDDSYNAWLALINSACCEKAETQCANGLPTSCDEEARQNLSCPCWNREPCMHLSVHSSKSQKVHYNYGPSRIVPDPDAYLCSAPTS